MSAAFFAGGVIGGMAINSLMSDDGVDTSGQQASAQISADVARGQLALGREELATARARQAWFDPLFGQAIQQSLTSQQTQDTRSAQQWQQYEDLFMPAEKRLAEQAANYDTPGRREQAAAEARAGVEQQAALQREEQQRRLERSGINLSSGRALTLDRAGALQTAKAAAGADAAARRQVEATGLSLTDNMVKTGRGITSTGLQAAQLALQGGNSAVGGLQAQQGTYNASLAPTTSLFAGANNSAGTMGSTYNGVAQVQASNNQAQAQNMQGIGQLAGMAMMYYSSPDVKTPTGRVSGREARRLLEDATTDPSTSSIDSWKYDPGVGDGGEHLGRYAGSVPGDPGGGQAIDVISELGLHNAAIADLSREVSQIAQDVSQIKQGGGRRTLSDVQDIAYRERA